MVKKETCLKKIEKMVTFEKFLSLSSFIINGVLMVLLMLFSPVYE